MRIDDAFRNREPETEPAVERTDGGFALLERFENTCLQMRLDADAVINEIHDHVSGRIVARRDLDAASSGCKFHCVAQNVPEHFLETRGIREAVVFRCEEAFCHL